MRLLGGICIIMCVGWVTAAHAKPPVGRGADEKKTAARKALTRKISEDAGIMGALKSHNAFGGKMSSFGTIGGDFRKADAAYERGDWTKAHALYAKGDVLAEKHLRYGVSRAVMRYAHACQALGRSCAIEAADALHAAARGGFGAGLEVSGRRDRRSRLSRVMSDLMSKRRRAHQALERGKGSEADKLWAALYQQDPRCPGRDCPPFTLREVSGMYARAGRFEAAGEALGAFVEALPKHPERKALKRQITTWASQAKQAKQADAAALAANRARVPKPTTKAPWMRSAKRTPSPRFTSIRYGGAVGVARLSAGQKAQWMGMRVGAPVVQGLAIPAKPKWVGVGGDGRIYYATAEGALFQATLETAKAPFTAMGAAPGAAHWDVQGETVVASDDTRVWTWSKGATTPHRYTHPQDIGSAWTRADGVVVFGDAAGASVSADGGRTWTHSALGNMRGLRRDGQRVVQRPSAPMPGNFGQREYPSRCAQGVLTADLKWVVPADDYWGRRDERWSQVFALHAGARGLAALPNGRGMAAPQEGIDAAAEIAKCRADREAYFKRGGAGGIAAMGRGCAGLACLDAPSAPATPIRFALLGDGGCAGDSERVIITPVAAKKRTFGRQVPAGCAGLKRAGTLMRVTATDFAPLPAIANCAPERIDSMAGIGVVSCVEANGARALVVLDDKGVERERLALTSRPHQLGSASDGTLAVTLSGTHAGAIRRPVALGAANAWRIDTVPGAEVWRPAPGGHGIALASGSKAEAVFARPSVHRTRVDGVRDYQTWASRRTEAIKGCHATAFAADPTLEGRLILTVDIDAAGQVAGLATDNRMTGDSQAFLACVMAALQADTGRAFAATEIVHLSLGSKNNSLRATLTAPGKPAEALTDDVIFERPPQQISARDDGSVEVQSGGYPTETCTLPKAGALLCPRKR